MSLATPEKIRTLQRKLYRKPKAEPAYGFYLLYDKIYREDILRHAYALVCAGPIKCGCAGHGRNDLQGGVVSPLLANIYMNRFLKYWRLTGRGEAFRAHVIAYADDFVTVSISTTSSDRIAAGARASLAFA